MRRISLFHALASLVFVAACSISCDSYNNSNYPAPAFDLTGTWVGTGSDSTGSAQLTVHFIQNGNNVTGTATSSNSGGTVNGTISGTVSGTTATLTETVPVGGISSSPACGATFNIVATNITNTTITGTYSGQFVGCQQAISNGQFTLAKQ